MRKGRLLTKEFEMIFLDDVSFRAQAIYQYIRYRQGKNEDCYHTHKRIARDNKCSVSTVKRAIEELVNKGYIERVHQRRSNGSKTSNRYVCK